MNIVSIFCQYHGLGLLYHIKKQDRLAISKLLNKFTKSQMKSPYAMCMMVSVVGIKPDAVNIIVGWGGGVVVKQERIIMLI